MIMLICCLHRSASYLASHTISVLQESVVAALLDTTNASASDGGNSFNTRKGVESLLQRVHSALQYAAVHDPDNVVRFHAGHGLCILDEIRRAQFQLLLAPSPTSSQPSIQFRSNNLQPVEIASINSYRFDTTK